MKKLLTLSLFILPALLTAQEINLAELLTGIDSSLLVNANQVVREEVQRYQVQNEAEGQFYYRSKVTLLNKEAYGKYLYVYYDKDSKPSKLRAVQYDRFGKEVKSYKMKDFQDRSAISDFSIYEEDRIKILEIEPSQYPCTIEFEYEQKFRGVSHVIYPKWQPQSFYESIENASYTIELNNNDELNYKTYNITEEPEINTIDGRKSYSWSIKNRPAVIKESQGPIISELLPILVALSNSFKIDHYSGSMRSWEDYGKFILELYQGKDELPDALVAQIKAITADASNDREKIRLLYRFMQDNMRYVSVQLGIGGWQPFSAQYVYDNGYGDCKALSNYMHAMLKEVGIESYPTVIKHGETFFEIDEDFAYPAFNHVILYVPEEDMWLECTSNYNPAGYLGTSTADHTVLWITPDGGQLAQTPKLTADENKTIEEVTIKLSETGAASLDFQGEYHAGEHDVWRYYEFMADSKDQEEYLRKSTSLPSFKLTNLALENSRTAPTAKVNYQIEIPRYAAKAGKRLFVPLNTLNPNKSAPDADEARQHPIYIRYGYTEESTITIELPEGYKIEGLKIKEEKVESSFGKYEVRTETSGNQVKYYRKLRIEETELPATDYEQYRDFYLQVAKLDGAKMVLVQQKT